MSGYPITYGDTLSSEESLKNIKRSSTQLCIYSTVFFVASGISYAVEIVPNNNANGVNAGTNNAETVSKILTTSACLGAGKACTDPKTRMALLTCGLLFGWCAAKASPI